MDVSACPLLRHLYLTDVCGAQGWISRGKLLVWVDVSDKVHIIFCLTEGRKWKWQLRAQWWLWFWFDMKIYADMWDINARLLCGLRGIFLWSVILVLCCTMCEYTLVCMYLYTCCVIEKRGFVHTMFVIPKLQKWPVYRRYSCWKIDKGLFFVHSFWWLRKLKNQ